MYFLYRMGKLDNDDEDAKYLKDLVQKKLRLDVEEKELDKYFF